VEQLGQITLGVDVPVTVAGHTDTIPISSSRFQSNWELSAARAAGVARALVAMGHDPDEVQVTAFGEYRPIDTNDTPEGRARNRRVELFYSKLSVEEAVQRAGSEEQGAGSGERGAESGEQGANTTGGGT
jgi:chemotaxis protein MotB